MSVVSIKIRNVNYSIACDEGQEENLLMIGNRLDKRVSAMATNLGKAQDMQLMVMTALMMENEISDLKKMANTANPAAIDTGVAETLEAIAEYIENLANHLEKV